MWGTVQKINFRRKKESVLNDGKGNRLKITSNRSIKLDPICLGEMWGHSDSVNQLLAFAENGFASCSNDGTVILWKVKSK
jgi:hypothetical protein